MHIFEMIAIISVFAIIAGIVREWLKHKETPKVDLAPIESKLAEIDSLKARVAVLEKIVTDKNYDLKTEFENLK